MPKVTISIEVDVPIAPMAIEIQESLQQIARLSGPTLKVLAEKAQKPGIEEKLQQFKAFI